MSNPSRSGRAGRAWWQTAVVVLLLSTAACHEKPTAPSAPRVAIEGTWAGSITDRNAGTAQLSLTVSGLEPVGFGTFSLTFPDTAANARGIVQGRTQDAPTIELLLLFEAGGRDCSGIGTSYQARVALTGNRMTGTYSPAVGCPLLAGGSLELTRQ